MCTSDRALASADATQGPRWAGVGWDLEASATSPEGRQGRAWGTASRVCSSHSPPHKCSAMTEPRQPPRPRLCQPSVDARLPVPSPFSWEVWNTAPGLPLGHLLAGWAPLSAFRERGSFLGICNISWLLVVF